MKVSYEGEIWETEKMHESLFNLIQSTEPDYMLKIIQGFVIGEYKGLPITLITKIDFVEIKNLTVWKPT